MPYSLLEYPGNCYCTRLDRPDATVALIVLHQGQELIVCMQLSWGTSNLKLVICQLSKLLEAQPLHDYLQHHGVDNQISKAWHAMQCRRR